MSIEAMKQALEALEIAVGDDAHDYQKYLDAITSLRQATAEAEKQQDIFKQLGNQSWLQLWQSYCDLKVERDELKDKLAEADKQEPVGVFREDGDIGYIDLLVHQQIALKEGDLLYTHPSKREPLTDEQIKEGWRTLPIRAPMSWSAYEAGVRMAEAAHGIKGQS